MLGVSEVIRLISRIASTFRVGSRRLISQNPFVTPLHSRSATKSDRSLVCTRAVVHLSGKSLSKRGVAMVFTWRIFKIKSSFLLVIVVLFKMRSRLSHRAWVVALATVGTQWGVAHAVRVGIRSYVHDVAVVSQRVTAGGSKRRS